MQRHMSLGQFWSFKLTLLNREWIIHSITLLLAPYLSDECVWLDSAISIHLRHVHIINEIDQFLCAWRTKTSTRFLLQWFFHHFLQHHGRGVVVEGNSGHQSILIQSWDERDSCSCTYVCCMCTLVSKHHTHIHMYVHTYICNGSIYVQLCTCMHLPVCHWWGWSCRSQRHLPASLVYEMPSAGPGNSGTS